MSQRKDTAFCQGETPAHTKLLRFENIISANHLVFYLPGVAKRGDDP